MALRRIVLGQVNGLFGVTGWLKVYSFTRPPCNILEFDEWLIGRRDDWRPFRVLESRIQGKSIVVRLGDAGGEPLPDRDAAAELLDLEIAVAPEAMPEPESGTYYWFDLIGLEVVCRDGASLGRVQALMETGANDVLVVQGERERLIPFVVGDIVDAVDLEAGRIVADWDPDF